MNMNVLFSNLSAAQLRQAAKIKERIDELSDELNRVLQQLPRGSARQTRGGSRRGRKMSPSGRARLAALARARWKKVKASGKNAL